VKEYLLMTDRYQPQDLEAHWQAAWERAKLFDVDEDKSQPKYYLLEMFPYPSGRIHMGHVRNYTIGDVVARFKRMRGYNVLHPMGWDAFGMPAENAAIAARVHPAKWTYANIAAMKAQLKRLGFSYDWRREVATCDPRYYKWEQMVFLRLLEKGQAYRKKSQVNYCPKCETVLANEQVEGGACWRCGEEVVQREQWGWFLRITDYAQELLDWIDRLPGWPERVLTMQRNWIGRSEGATIRFDLIDPPAGFENYLEVFTTRPDTVFGATFMSLAAEHPLAKALSAGTAQAAAVAGFQAQVARQTTAERLAEGFEKVGVFTGGYCKNPATGATIPIFAANFVLLEYGTGAVMAVPGHDQRDHDFAAKYGLPIVEVVQPENEADSVLTAKRAWTGPGVMVNSGPYDGLPNETAKERIAADLKAQGRGGPVVSYRLRDWGISRQRY
jgi:leucyl-tRNA synthetase